MEIKSEKLKVAFFFGAGVEGKGNFDIESGYDYLKRSLLAPIFHMPMLEALDSYFDSKEYFKNYSYQKNGIAVERLLRNFLVQKSVQSIDFFEKHNATLAVLLTKEDWKSIQDNTQDSPIFSRYKIDKPTNTVATVPKDKLEKEFRHIITGEIKEYSSIPSPIFKDFFTQGEKDKIHPPDLNVGIGGILDSYFHTIIDPTKYGRVKFSKIFNYYWACYFTIVRSVLKYLSNNGVEEAKSYLKYDGELDYSKVLSNLHQLTKMLYSPDMVIPIEGSYYDYIRKAFAEYDSQIECAGIITTNYYQFASQINKDAIYLNGQLKLFEYPELLEISDVYNHPINSDRLFFPFIFGQSLVKPIVDKTQIQAFQGYYDCLQNADILVIMGFNINEDDNHINSFLHHYATQGKRLIVVSNQENFDVHKRLKCKIDEVEQCKVTYIKSDDIDALHKNNQAIVKQLFEQILKKEIKI